MTESTPAVAVVTGASGALGASIARELVGRGIRVVLAYRNGAETAERLHAELGEECTGLVRADLADRGAPAAIFGAAARWGAPTVLVNNAGAMTEVPVAGMSDDTWDRLIDVNLSASFRMSREAIPGMLRAGGGRIVNISSQAAFRGSVGRAHYAAAKAGLLGLTYSLARELGPAGVTVNAVVPGRIESDMISGHSDERKRVQWLENTPLGRLGTPAEVASAVGFLTSPEASYITGATLQVGGGLVMG